MNDKRGIGWLLFLVATLSPSLAGAAVEVQSMAWISGARPRMVVDLSSHPRCRIGRTADSGRLVIDLGEASLHTGLKQPPTSHPAARIGASAASGHLRLRVDLRTPVAHRAHIEKHGEGSRLVLEFGSAPLAQGPMAATRAPATPGAKSIAAREQKAAPDRQQKPAPAKPPVVSANPKQRPFVIAIDAGHGGMDSGAIGPNGVREKDVVLDIARKLAGFVRAEPGLAPLMVRDGDEFVDLRERAAIARRGKADLFVSLHADAYDKEDVRGSSVFTLSANGASSEAARWLEDSENASLRGGVSLADKGKVLASVLVDLSKNATMEASDRAAAKVLRELRKGFDVHHEDIQKAGFVVLKSLDVPSMLVETAFISNPDEERNLSDPKRQAQIARAIFYGVRAYFAERRPVTPVPVSVADAWDSLTEGARKAVAEK